MYICICNAITEKDIKENPELNKLVGTVCGMCLQAGQSLEVWNHGTKKESDKWVDI